MPATEPLLRPPVHPVHQQPPAGAYPLRRWLPLHRLRGAGHGAERASQHPGKAPEIQVHKAAAAVYNSPPHIHELNTVYSYGVCDAPLPGVVEYPVASSLTIGLQHPTNKRTNHSKPTQVVLHPPCSFAGLNIYRDDGRIVSHRITDSLTGLHDLRSK